MDNATLEETTFLDQTFPQLVRMKGLGGAMKTVEMYLALWRKYKHFPVVEYSTLITTYLHPSALPVLDRLVSVYYPPVTNTVNQIPVPIRKVAAGIGSHLYE